MGWQDQVLTKNARNWFYLYRNHGRSIADSKLKTKRRLARAGVPVPKILGLLKDEAAVNQFAWEKINGGFVVKPVSGYGGEGVLIVKKRAKWAGEWWSMDGRKINVSDLRYWAMDILQGRYSLHNFPDWVLIEERIKILPQFLRFTRSGTPDIRVIVYRRIPVMAMLRLPTPESHGKANLHQGAIGLGLDLATGITTFGVHRQQPISTIYDLRRHKRVKVNGFRIPHWRTVLETAIRAQEAVPGLRFVGVDIVLDKEKGPLVLELNARPGLAIQICNRAGLRERLRRVEGINVRNSNHAINIAGSLFGESFVDKVDPEGKLRVISTLEAVKIKVPGQRQRQLVLAKIDTGAYRTSIDYDLAKQLGLLRRDNIIDYRHYRNALGQHHRRPVISLTFWLGGQKIVTAANISRRHHLNTKVLVGRRDLHGFVVKVGDEWEEFKKQRKGEKLN